MKQTNQTSGTSPTRAAYGSGNRKIDLPGWPRLLSIPLSAAYLSRTVAFIEVRLRNGEIPYHIQDGLGRVIDRLDLDAWVDRQRKYSGKMREPKAATRARQLRAVA